MRKRTTQLSKTDADILMKVIFPEEDPNEELRKAMDHYKKLMKPKTE